eukprot:403355215
MIKFQAHNGKQIFHSLFDADDRVFGDADRTLRQIYRDNDVCYNIFSLSVGEIYIGFLKLTDQFSGQSDLSKIEQLSTFSDFCYNEPNLIDYVDDLANYLLSEGECDVLQALYEGDISSNIWQGWRDNIDDKAGYMIMYLAEGIVVLNACQNVFKSEFGYNETNEQNQARQQQVESSNDKFAQVINRTLEYDQKALNSINETIETNLRELLIQFQNTSLQVMALNVNYFTLSQIYVDYLLKMGTTYSNVSGDDYDFECWNCVQMTEGDFNVLVDWLPVDSKPAFPPDALQQIDYTEGMSSEDLMTQIWDKLGNCTSGVVWVKPNVPAYISNLQGDRVSFRLEESIIMLAWGVNEICNGRPPQPQS